MSHIDFTLVGLNDNFNSPGSNLEEALQHDPDFVFIQEGKGTRYRALRDHEDQRLLPYGRWAVHQDSSSEARAGSVVLSRLRPKTRLKKSGFTFGVRARGLLPRWIAWVKALVDACRLFLFSAHRPPVRARRWWHPYDLSLWALLRAALAGGWIVIGEMDSNEHGGPPRLPRGLKWVAKGNDIDGFVLSRSVEVLDGPRLLPKNTSDHHPVLLKVRVHYKRRAAR